MSDVTRVFIGVPIPVQFRVKLERLGQNLAKVVPQARWVHPEDFHVTLAFLGDVPHADLRDVCRAVAEVTSVTPAFDLKLSGAGAFPDPVKPRVLWAGVDGDLDALSSLRAVIVEAVAKVGYPPDDDRFHPHVTLGRLKSGRDSPSIDLTNQVAHLRTWTAGPWTADSVIVYGSHPAKEGPSYATLGTARMTRRISKGDG